MQRVRQASFSFRCKGVPENTLAGWLQPALQSALAPVVGRHDGLGCMEDVKRALGMA
jgi:hypothetical protein